MENQAEYDLNKRWVEITRNQYQEIIINSGSHNNLVAYYDEGNNESFYVLEKSAQCNTPMKIKKLKYICWSVIDGRNILRYFLNRFEIVFRCRIFSATAPDLRCYRPNGCSV